MKNEEEYKILFAVDPLEPEMKPNEADLSWFREFASERNATIEVVYVLSGARSQSSQDSKVTEFELEGYVKNLGLGNNTKAKLLVEPSSSRKKAVDTLVDYAKKTEAKIIAITSHGRSGLGRLVMGSFAESLLAISEVPILFLNNIGNKKPPANKILFATDFSVASKAALEIFLAQIKGYQGEMVVFNAVPPPGAIYDTGYLGLPIFIPENYWIDLRMWTDRESDELLKKVKAKGFQARLVVQNGVTNTAAAIQLCALDENVGLVAMASLSRGFDSVVMGSVAKELFRLKKWPVWICGPEVLSRIEGLDKQ